LLFCEKNEIVFVCAQSAIYSAVLRAPQHWQLRGAQALKGPQAIGLFLMAAKGKAIIFYR